MSLAALPRSEYEGGTAIVLKVTNEDQCIHSNSTWKIIYQEPRRCMNIS